MSHYESDLVLGKQYRDKATGLTGSLVVVSFFEHACERGTLRYLDLNAHLQEASFDAPELVRIDTGEAAQSERPGGPDRGGAGRASAARR